MRDIVKRPLNCVRKHPIIRRFTDPLVWHQNDFWRKIDYLRGYIEYRMSGKPSINPFELYHIDPQKVVKTSDSNNFRSLRISPVVGGEWDQNCSLLENYDIMYSLENHFNEGTPWEETDFYSRAIESIEGNKEWQGRAQIQNLEDLQIYLERIERLYRNIKLNGFKKQRQIVYSEEFYVPVFLAYERHDVTVSIARNGEFLLENGWHRMAISKALGLDEIPVRIRIRHKKWREKRREALEKDGPVPDHPDIEKILK